MDNWLRNLCKFQQIVLRFVPVKKNSFKSRTLLPRANSAEKLIGESCDSATPRGAAKTSSSSRTNPASGCLAMFSKQAQTSIQGAGWRDLSVNRWVADPVSYRMQEQSPARC